MKKKKKKWVLLAVLISAILLSNCGAQIKLSDPKSIFNYIKDREFEITDYGYYGSFIPERTGINFENYRNFKVGEVLPSNYAETFDINKLDLGLVKVYVVEIFLPNYPKENEYLGIKFQPNEDTYNFIVRQIHNYNTSKEDLKLLLSGEYLIYIGKDYQDTDTYKTKKFIDGDFNEESDNAYDYFKMFRYVYEGNFLTIKKYISEKGWEKGYKYDLMPDGTLILKSP
jgi:hypothetical protein